MVLGVHGLVGNFGIAEIAAKGVLKVIKTGLNVRWCSLQEGLDRAIGKIADITRQTVTARRTLGGVPKANALHASLENDMSGNLIHGLILESSALCRNKKGETVDFASPTILFQMR